METVVKFPMIRLDSQDEMSQKASESTVELALPFTPSAPLPAAAKRRAWPIYCACFVLNLIGLGPFYSSTTILAWYTDRKLLSSSEAALISSFYVFTALWDPVTAAIIAKLGSRKSGCVGLALAIIGTLASSFCTNKPKLLWLFFGVFTGWGAGGFLVLIATCLPLQYADKNPGRVMGIVTSANAIGGCIFAIVSQPILSRFGPAWTFRLVAGIFLLTGLPSILVLRDLPVVEKAVCESPLASPEVSKSYDSPLASPITHSFETSPSIFTRASFMARIKATIALLFPCEMLRIRNFQLLSLATFLLAFSVFYFSTFVAPISGAFGYPASYGSWLIVIFNICAIASRLGLCWLCDYVHSALVLAISLGLAGVFVALTFTLAAYKAAFAFAAVVAGLTSGGIYSVLALSVSQMYGADQAMRGYAFVESMSAIGYLAGPFIAGYVSDHTYSQTSKSPLNWGALWAGAMLLISSSLCLWLYLRIKRIPKRQIIVTTVPVFAQEAA